MARRTSRPTGDFLNAVFHPSKAKKPTGLRKSSASVNSKRKASRVRAFNRLEPFKQQIIIKAGNKEAYLRGTATLADSRAILRPQAIGLGVAKSITPSARAIAALVAAASERPPLDNRNKPKGSISVKNVASNVAKMSQSQKARAARVRSYEDLLELIEDTTDDEGYSIYFYK